MRTGCGIKWGQVQFRSDWGVITLLLAVLEGEGFVNLERAKLDRETGQDHTFDITARGQLETDFDHAKGIVLNHSRMLDVHRTSDFPEIATLLMRYLKRFS